MKISKPSLAAMAVGIAATVILIANPPENEPTDQCNDGVAVTYAADGTIKGDQNKDGKLSGDDCDWR